MRVFVTGGAGFIGSALIWKLNQEGIDDIIIADELGNSEKWKNLVGLRFTDLIQKEKFLHLVETDQLGKTPDAVIHLGAITSTTEKNADLLLENNYRYTYILADWAVKFYSRFIYASSAATYGDGSRGFSDAADIDGLFPLNMYGYSKHLFDLHALRAGFADKVLGLKFFNVYGPNEYHKADMVSHVYRGYHQVKSTGSIKLFKSYRADYPDGEQKRDFVYVKDCVDILWWFLQHPSKNGLFNVGSGKARSWNDLARAIFSALGREPNIEYIEMPEALRGSYQYYTEATMEKLADTGCPLPSHSLEDGVRDYVVNYLERNDRHLAAP